MRKQPADRLEPLRCPHCGRLLARVRMVRGCVVEIQCRNCKRLVLLESR